MKLTWFLAIEKTLNFITSRKRDTYLRKIYKLSVGFFLLFFEREDVINHYRCPFVPSPVLTRADNKAAFTSYIELNRTWPACISTASKAIKDDVLMAGRVGFDRRGMIVFLVKKVW